MEVGLVLCLPRDGATAHVTREVLDAALTVLGADAAVRDDITLALGEACANVIQHADPSDEYEVRVRVIDSRCEVEVVDTGRGFDAEQLDQAAADATVSAEHGRGLQIIDTLCDNLRILNRRQRGAMVRFEKPLTWAPSSPGLLLAGEGADPDAPRSPEAHS